jgi:transposase
MGCPTRIYYTEADKAQIWDRWQEGESINAIVRDFGRSLSSIQGILARCGGLRSPARRRSRLALTLAECEEISRGLVGGSSIRSIAAPIGRSALTVSRELRRNGGRRQYRASTADQAAWDRAHRAKRCKLARHTALARLVADKLRLQWSPRQIAGWPKRTYRMMRPVSCHTRRSTRPSS